MTNTNVIAEIGCNHKGDIKIAKKMIDTASKFCNAKIVKFESFKPKGKAFNMLLGRLWLAEFVLRSSKWKKTILFQK